MNPVNAWESLTGARLLDFVGARTPWPRTLWNPGLVLGLREILEASEAAQTNVLSNEALSFTVNAAKHAARVDMGLGSRTQLAALQTALVSTLQPHSVDYFAVEQLAEHIQREYLANWAAAIRATPAIPPTPERVARAVSAHLLDLGFNSDFLHRWWTYRLRYENPRRPISDLIDEAHALACEQPRTLEVLVAFDSFPPSTSGRPAGWIDNAAVATWLSAHQFSTAGVKQNGGIVLDINARDPDAAAYLAAETIENLAARARIATSGTNSELRRLPMVWVAGEQQPKTIGTRSRPLNVRALIREGVVYQHTTGDETINAAFEMLGPLHDGSPIAAIAGGWGAIEALLADGERGSAADRLAMIVTCSYPRAELTSLSYALERDDAAMHAALQGMTVNRDRAILVANAINAGQALVLTRPSDQAALQRMAAVLARPAPALADIQSYVTGTFRRLYRQRNLVLHGGKTNAVALRASLRTAAPLVGAGFDRIAHAHYVSQLQPKAIAAHARIALQTINDHTGCATLLP